MCVCVRMRVCVQNSYIKTHVGLGQKKMCFWKGLEDVGRVPFLLAWIFSVPNFLEESHGLTVPAITSVKDKNLMAGMAGTLKKWEPLYKDLVGGWTTHLKRILVIGSFP